MNNYCIANLFHIDALREVCKANYSLVSIKNNMEYYLDESISLNKVNSLSHKVVVFMNDFCIFNTWKIIDFIQEKFSKGFKLILPENISYPLQLIPFCINIDDWSVNFIRSYISSGMHNLDKFIDYVGASSFIYRNNQWASNNKKSLILNCMQYNLDDIFTIMIDQNYRLGII